MRLNIKSWQAVGVLTALTLLLIALSVSFLLWDLRARELKHAREESSHLAGLLAEQVEQSFGRAAVVLQGVQERLESGMGQKLELDSLPVHLLLMSRAAGLPQMRSVFLVTADGKVVNSSREQVPVGMDVSQREFFRLSVGEGGGDLYFGRPERANVDGRWAVYMARRLRGPDGRLRGLVVASMNPEHFERLSDYVKFDYARSIALYLDDGSLVASMPHRDEAVGKRAVELGQNMPAVEPGSVVTLPATGSPGRDNTVFLCRVKGFPLLVGVTDDEGEALADWRETAFPTTLGAGLMSLVIAIVAFILSWELRRDESLTRALREADDRYQRTMDSVMDAIVAVDESRRIVLFNAAAERMFGLRAAEVVGSSLDRLIPERLRAKHGGLMARFLESGEQSRAMAGRTRILGVRADGTEFPVESTISQAIIGGQRQFTAVLRDISERYQAEQDLREANAELRRLSSSLEKVREEERARISRELHDELGQLLTGLKLELSWLSHRMKEGRSAPPEKVAAMRQLLDRAVSSVRRISSELRPLILDDLGFGEAVAWQADEFSKRSGIQTVLDLSAADLVRDDAMATGLFRIVQESLTNVARHADASRVEVRLFEEEGRLILTVSDNGRGLPKEIRQGAIGLASMRERATALGGQFSIVGSPGAGVTIKVALPSPPMVAEGEQA